MVGFLVVGPSLSGNNCLRNRDLVIRTSEIKLSENQKSNSGTCKPE